jgi:hypothetical protein
MRIVFFLLLVIAAKAGAAVLPDERADLLYHKYDGGGVEVDGPSVLVRKNVGDSFSVGVNHYVDNVTSASIDVQVSASEYTEERTESNVSLDYLRQKTTVSFGYTVSDESDYEAETLSLGVSQDLFGDLTTVSMSFAYGDNTVGRNGDDAFEEEAKVRSYRFGISQILTKSLVMAFTLETITDEGYLNNPYRSVRYCLPPDCSTTGSEGEFYPETRTSNAIAVRGNYFLPQRAALHAGVRYFEDSWDIEATTFELGYTMPYGENIILEATYRFHDQTSAEFYSDLFPGPRGPEATNYQFAARLDRFRLRRLSRPDRYRACRQRTSLQLRRHRHPSLCFDLVLGAPLLVCCCRWWHRRQVPTIARSCQKSISKQIR